MDRDELVRRLMATFLVELDEHGRALERDLLALELGATGETRAELFRTLLRTTHSLKGAARSVDVASISSVCHRMEEIFAAMRDGRSIATPETYALLFAVIDAIDDAGARLREGRPLHDAPISSMLHRMPVVPAARPAERPPAPQVAVTELPREDPPRSISPTSRTSNPSAEGLVRISARKLELLVRKSSELLIARRRVAAQHEEISVLHELTNSALRDWRRLEQSMRATLRRERARSSRNEIASDAALALDRMREALQRLEYRFERVGAALTLAQRSADQAGAALEDEVHRARMVPISEVCQGLSRIVRDLATAANKEADLVIEGGAVEVDRTVLEGLRQPLMHLVRNAIVHGIEVPEVRMAAGKARRGRIVVSANILTSGVKLTVEDDGRGIDLEAVRRQAAKQGLPLHSDERELARLVFRAGFSTTSKVTEAAGRGVGLDVVKSNVEAIHGRVDVQSTAGQGVRFVVDVPLTLGRLRTLLVRAGGQIFALADTNVARLQRVGEKDIATVDGFDVVLGGERPTRIATLAEVLGLPNRSTRNSAFLPTVVVSAGHREVALVVDELLDDHEVVIETLGRRLRRVRGVAGATILPTGGIALLLSVGELLRAALDRPSKGSMVASLVEAHPRRQARILVVDDSLTTRTLERSVLESVGHQVVTAGNGEEAWRLLQEQEIDLVVSDVEMPHMDGFTLTENIRQSRRLGKLPVVLVTGLASDGDRTRGTQVGADAYLVKSSFDQSALLSLVARLL